MPAKPKDTAPPAAEVRERRQLSDTIGQQVLQTLGRPDDLQQVQVRQLWENHYRVNVFTGLDATTVQLANSYFLVADGAGNIVKSDPKITKKY